MPRVIVNADDLGLCPSVNRAIFEVYAAGNLNSATLMVNMPGTHDAVVGLSHHPGLAVGLHFCITEGKALTGRSPLTDGAGVFLGRTALIRRMLSGKVPSAAIREEFDAQWDLAVALGVVPDHVDSHQHVMMLPAILDAVLPAIHQRKVPTRIVAPPWTTITSDRMRPRRALKQAANLAFATYARHRLKVPKNSALVSIHDLEHAGPYDANTFHTLIARAHASADLEVMVHPYLLGSDVKDLYASVWQDKEPFLRRCAAEYEALLAPGIFSGLDLITFNDL
ncbi:MAG: ChbG/HpnK family deacetylase [Flavobacteriales bacterium]|jgi:chitin disaccharide deacetylase|nr:ChbG/HpnK family deacetylase [Flavobacteriales bacterium]MBK9512084.1 ChbG/HpnK family deacetylase [Flavobacteriales bacterium]MBP7448510.1 ChbG/HpnK family deacetylase [Flavobacteriales bacterium]HOZ39930.1 ChbG/HpnK family deacetylase [Flavobacteriales bacterium]